MYVGGVRIAFVTAGPIAKMALKSGFSIKFDIGPPGTQVPAPGPMLITFTLVGYDQNEPSFNAGPLYANCSVNRIVCEVPSRIVPSFSRQNGMPFVSVVPGEPNTW